MNNRRKDTQKTRNSKEKHSKNRILYTKICLCHKKNVSLRAKMYFWNKKHIILKKISKYEI